MILLPLWFCWKRKVTISNISTSFLIEFRNRNQNRSLYRNRIHSGCTKDWISIPFDLIEKRFWTTRKSHWRKLIDFTFVQTLSSRYNWQDSGFDSPNLIKITQNIWWSALWFSEWGNVHFDTIFNIHVDTKFVRFFFFRSILKIHVNKISYLKEQKTTKRIPNLENKIQNNSNRWINFWNQADQLLLLYK